MTNFIVKKLTCKLSVAVNIFLCCLTTIDSSQSQIIPDNTLPNNSQVIQEGNHLIIEGGTTTTGGNNLFHSFEQFSLPTGAEALFSNDPSIQNIFSRVSGNLPSNIDGLIKANGTANLFLINPNGIIFGPNATLNIGGSFLASTADSVIFDDGTHFSATNPQIPSSLLRVNVPFGLQFGKTPGDIEISGQAGRQFTSLLQVRDGKNITLVGGNISITNRALVALGGRIELGSIASSSLVKLNPIDTGWALKYDRGVQNFGDLYLSQSYVITNTKDLGGGAIQLRGRQIKIADGSVIQAQNQGEKPGESIVVTASELIELRNQSFLSTSTGSGSKQKAGDIEIATGRLIIQNGSKIEASTSGTGQGGNLFVNASEFVEVTNKPSRLATFTTLAYDAENAGSNAGNAGNLEIITNKLILNEGGQISTSTFGAGNGGILKVKTTEVEINDFPSGMFTQSRGARTTGNGGVLEIITDRLRVRNGGRISVSAVEGSTGKGGSLIIRDSDSVEVTGIGTNKKNQVVPSTLLAESQESGEAGNLIVETNKLIVRDGAEITAKATGEGSAGDVTVNAGIIQLNRGTITASTNNGTGGNVFLNANNLLLMKNNSQILAEANNQANGGNVVIKIPFIVAVPNEDSNISANAFKGNGGNINIATQGIFGIQFRERETPLSDITASSQFGTQGQVTIAELNVDFTKTIVQLPSLIDPSQQIARGCPSQGRISAEQLGSFTITGRGGLPPSPTDPRSSEPVLTDWATLEVEGDRDSEAEVKTDAIAQVAPQPIIEAQGWKISGDGKIILVAQTPVVMPQVPALNDTNCRERASLQNRQLPIQINRLNLPPRNHKAIFGSRRN